MAKKKSKSKSKNKGESTTRALSRRLNLKEEMQPPALDPEVVEPGEEDESAGAQHAAPIRMRRFDKLLARIRRGRRRIEKRIEARAIKLGIDPEPLIKGLWELLMLMPRLMRLTLKLLIDKRVPVRLRLLCGLSLVYVLSPIDLVPAAIFGPAGYIDDLALMLIVLDMLVNEVDAAIVQEHWTGDEDVLEIIKESVSLVEWFLPAPVHDAIKAFFRKRGR